MQCLACSVQPIDKHVSIFAFEDTACKTASGNAGSRFCTQHAACAWSANAFTGGTQSVRISLRAPGPTDLQ